MNFNSGLNISVYFKNADLFFKILNAFYLLKIVNGIINQVIWIPVWFFLYFSNPFPFDHSGFIKLAGFNG